MTAIQQKHARDTEAAIVHNDATHFDPALARQCPKCHIPVEMMVHGQRVITATGGCLTCAVRVLVSYRRPWRQAPEPVVKPALQNLPDLPPEPPPLPKQPRPVIVRVCEDCRARGLTVQVAKQHRYCAACVVKRRAESSKRSHRVRPSRAKKPLDASVMAAVMEARA